MIKRILGVLTGMCMVGTVIVGQAGAVDRASSPRPPHDSIKQRGDYKPQPEFVEKWQSQKAAAAEAVAKGEARVRQNGTVRMHNGQFVEYEREGEDHIVTLLAEFSDPVAGAIEEPDRSVNNSTYWEEDFSREHYQEMLFSEGGNPTGFPSMRDFYLEMSSGRYTVNGQVSEWVSIPEPESEYGADSPSGGDGSDNLNGPVYRVVEAALNATDGVDEGVNWDPGTVDVWDRYDCDGDGNFDEADGYIDHFQLVHAGQGQEEGGGAQGTDAIWSHRWYAGQDGYGVDGPAACPFGGYQVPGTELWVGDYTIEPENGAVGVFAHEFGHDLGLPDLYDTSGLGENNTTFWTLMSSGSWASADPEAIGTMPTHMDAWSKMVLGWIQGDDLGVVDYEPGSTTQGKRGGGSKHDWLNLGPAEGATEGNHQAIRVDLPDYEYAEELIEPEAGDPYYYYSDSGDDLENTMTHDLGAPLGADTDLTFRTWYEIETDWDYAYVEASSDGTTWTPLDGNLSTDDDPNGQNQGNGITGSSGDAWVDGVYSVPAGTTMVRFRYWTDGAFIEPGFFVDSIQLGDFSDDGSNTDAWEFGGFIPVENGEILATAFHYYLIESRSYIRNDVSLKGAYNFIEGDWLEKEPFADGVLVWYRDGRWEDNNVGQHPGHGQILPVDAHPDLMVMPDGETYWRTRWQSWDSTFGGDHDRIRLTQVVDGEWETESYRARPVNTFYDSSPTAYYNADKPDMGTMTAGSGLKVKFYGGKRGFYKVRIE